MGKLIYAALTSLDGFINDANGSFSWAAPEEDVHTFVNELEQQNGVVLFGRAMYEIMAVWEDIPNLAKQPKYIQDYATAWKQMQKIVFSRTLQQITTSNTILERGLIKEKIVVLKEQTRKNIGIGGANLASQAFAMGLIDELYQFIFPVFIGTGKKWLTGSAMVNLEKVTCKEFLNGVVMLHYKVNQ